jgi:hypothetical protein
MTRGREGGSKVGKRRGDWEMEGVCVCVCARARACVCVRARACVCKSIPAKPRV